MVVEGLEERGSVQGLSRSKFLRDPLSVLPHSVVVQSGSEGQLGLSGWGNRCHLWEAAKPRARGRRRGGQGRIWTTFINIPPHVPSDQAQSSGCHSADSRAPINPRKIKWHPAFLQEVVMGHPPSTVYLGRHQLIELRLPDPEQGLMALPF